MYYINITYIIINIYFKIFFLNLVWNKLDYYHFAHHLKNAKHIKWKIKEIDIKKVS